MPNAIDRKPSHHVSPRAKRVWDRLQSWYGESMDQYGPFAPKDWCEAIDQMDAELEKRVLDEVRMRHRLYPPRFPEFDAIVARCKGPKGNAREQSIVERLADLMMKRYGLQMSFEQCRHPLYYVYKNASSLIGEPEVIACVCRADSKAGKPEFRVNVEDLALEYID